MGVATTVIVKAQQYYNGTVTYLRTLINQIILTLMESAPVWSPPVLIGTGLIGVGAALGGGYYYYRRKKA